jgi:hypothetical protein
MFVSMDRALYVWVSNVEPETLHKLVESIFTVHEDEEYGCEDCGCHVDTLAELVAAGADLSRLLPAVQEHLRCCSDCREEFEALVAIIQAQSTGSLSQTVQ